MIAEGVYHVTTRGNQRQMIYLSDLDREFFVRLLRKVVRECGWRLFAYTLMDNHYHLLVQTPDPNIATGLHQLNFTYARHFNGAHGLTGHLFEKRYASVVVEEDDHFLELIRYIALNPVRAGMCLRAEAWPWASYPSLVGDLPAPDFLDLERSLTMFASVQDLRAFVDSALKPLRVPGAHVLA